MIWCRIDILTFILDFPGNCYYEPLNLTIAPGESYNGNNDCTVYWCNDDLSVQGAGLVPDILVF